MKLRHFISVLANVTCERIQAVHVETINRPENQDDEWPAEFAQECGARVRGRAAGICSVCLFRTGLPRNKMDEAL